MTNHSQAADENVNHVYSSLADDPDLSELVVIFADEMPDRVSALLECLSAGDWETLSRLAHQFKSAVGSYGFDELVPFAGRLESVVRDGFAEDVIEDALDALTEMCRCVRGGSSGADA